MRIPCAWGRGDVDLICTLDEAHLASATLDVFGERPLPADHPFWHHPRITMTAHVCAVALAEPAIARIAERLVAIGRGDAAIGAIGPARGY